MNEPSLFWRVFRMGVSMIRLYDMIVLGLLVVGFA